MSKRLTISLSNLYLDLQNPRYEQQQSQNEALNIPAGQWHTVRALESGTVILEMKNGAYEPIGPEDILSL